MEEAELLNMVAMLALSLSNLFLKMVFVGHKHYSGVAHKIKPEVLCDTILFRLFLLHRLRRSSAHLKK